MHVRERLDKAKAMGAIALFGYPRQRVRVVEMGGPFSAGAMWRHPCEQHGTNRSRDDPGASRRSAQMRRVERPTWGWIRFVTGQGVR